jgi:hypothetical protein
VGRDDAQRANHRVVAAQPAFSGERETEVPDHRNRAPSQSRAGAPGKSRKRAGEAALDYLIISIAPQQGFEQGASDRRLRSVATPVRKADSDTTVSRDMPVKSLRVRPET